MRFPKVGDKVVIHMDDDNVDLILEVKDTHGVNKIYYLEVLEVKRCDSKLPKDTNGVAPSASDGTAGKSKPAVVEKPMTQPTLFALPTNSASKKKDSTTT